MNLNPLKWLNSTFEKKEGEIESLLEAQLRGTGKSNTKKARALGSTYEGYSKNGYLNTVVVYYCITMIAQKAGKVPIKLFQKAKKKEDRTEVFSHPVLDLIQNPNNRMDWESYLEAFLSYFFLNGTVYHRPIQVNSKGVKELQLFNPSSVKIIRNDANIAIGYEVEINGKKKKFSISKIDDSCEIKQFKNFNPLDEYDGVSVLSSAETVVDIINSGDTHNYNMLMNQARPSGALSYEPADGSPARMDDEQFDRLNDTIREQYSGTENSGKPLLLEGGLKWIQMSLSARDLDYLNSRGISQKDVCRAFKVPAVLLGLDNDSTYNNVREARLGLWDDAIIPNMGKVLNHLNKFIIPMFEGSEGLELVADYSKVSDLETRTERIWKRLEASDFLTLNEKRGEIGLDPIEGGDTTFISSGDMPLSLLNRGIQAADLNEIVAAGGQSEDTTIKPTKNPLDKTPKETPSKSFKTKSSDSELYRMIDTLTISFEKRMMPDVTEFLKEYGDKVEKAIVDYQEMGAEFAFVEFSENLSKVMAPHMEDVILTFGDTTLKSLSSKSNGAFLYKAEELIADVITTEEATKILLSSEWARRVAQYVESESLVRAKFVENSSRDAVRKIISDGVGAGRSYVEIAKEANEALNDKGKAMRIVTTEVHSAREYSSYEASKLSGLDVEKRWLSSGDGRTRSSHVVANGQTVPMNSKFIVGTSLMDHPGDSSAPAREVISCRCSALYEPII